MDTYYNVFTRTWWKDAERPGWPNNLEPQIGKKTYLAKHMTYSDAREVQKEYNDTHDPGRYSRKAELEAI